MNRTKKTKKNWMTVTMKSRNNSVISTDTAATKRPPISCRLRVFFVYKNDT